ncbi:hypothetical protein [Salinarimonas rosea]|uniref:hypothetical protein n=1 Tax=Salinarimonas rosea TaxID=552063 RepID=UPI0012EB951F|nr:hypothetical protein [Salinarimonas rosea]
MIRQATFAAALAGAALLAGPGLAQTSSSTDNVASMEELDAMTQDFFTDESRTELVPDEQREAAFAAMTEEQRTMVRDHCEGIDEPADPAASSGWALLCEAVEEE